AMIPARRRAELAARDERTCVRRPHSYAGRARRPVRITWSASPAMIMTVIEWPTTTDLTLLEVLAERGCTVVRNFGERQDSRSVVLGIECANGERYVVKHAEDAQAIAWLDSARRFHADVQHSAVPTVVHHITTATGV